MHFVLYLRELKMLTQQHPNRLYVGEKQLKPLCLVSCFAYVTHIAVRMLSWNELCCNSTHHVTCLSCWVQEAPFSEPFVFFFFIVAVNHFAYFFQQLSRELVLICAPRL